jgi:hypothetical protein
MTDLVFEAVCAVCSIDWQAGITKDQRGRVNAAVKQLRDLYGEADAAVPMMIYERAAAWAATYPEIPLTPQALTGNWSTILNAAEAAREKTKEKERDRRRATNAHGGNRDCPTCGGDSMVVIMTTPQGHDVAGPCPECQ